MQRVFVIDANKQPLMPCRPGRARRLLKAGRAAVFKRYPFTIVMKDLVGGERQDLQLKIDPGAKTTGLALVADFKRGKRVVWAAEVSHRGQAIKKALADRAGQRRSRRARHTRYRPARFNNRRRPEGWLPPSLRSRLDNVLTWVNRIGQAAPLGGLALELVRFDTQLLQAPDISGVAYQQGELQGYEVREYLLDKWSRQCAYCGKTGLPLEVEHIVPKSRGGSNRVSNLTLACHACNTAKGSQTAAEFGYGDIQAQARVPLKDAAALNATRWALYAGLQRLGLPVEVGTGGRTKFNRCAQGYPKAHWIDAACVGPSGQRVYLAPAHQSLLIQATGRQRRQMTLVDKYGFPRSRSKGPRSVHGFQTGDLVVAFVPRGKRAGKHAGRIAVKAYGSFTVDGTPDIHWKYCRRIQAADGYDYHTGGSAHSPVA